MTGWVGGAGGALAEVAKDLGGWRGRQRAWPRCSNAAGLNTHARTPRHASIAPEVPSKVISSPRLFPSLLPLSTSNQVVLNITSVSPSVLALLTRARANCLRPLTKLYLDWQGPLGAKMTV
jgi:hypothetical protein